MVLLVVMLIVTSAVGMAVVVEPVIMAIGQRL